jgi:hypothetical protein
MGDVFEPKGLCFRAATAKEGLKTSSMDDFANAIRDTTLQF